MDRAAWLRRFHALATIGWAVMIPVSILTGLRNSLPFLVGDQRLRAVRCPLRRLARQPRRDERRPLMWALCLIGRRGFDAMLDTRHAFTDVSLIVPPQRQAAE